MNDSPPTWYVPRGNKELDNPNDRGKAMVEAARIVQNLPDEQERCDLDLAYARMFESAPITDLTEFAGDYYGSGQTSAASFSYDDRSTWNVMRSVIMTAAAMVFRTRVRCRFITNGGEREQRRRSQKLTAFADGMTAEAQLYEIEQEAGIDSMVFRAGAVEPYLDENKRVRYQRILAAELSVDPRDARYGVPRSMYRRRLMDKDLAAYEFRDRGKDVVAAIENARTVNNDGARKSGMLCIRQAWHLKSGDDAKDGWQLIALDDDGTVLQGSEAGEEWTKDYFPPVLLHWQRARVGMWGRSLAEQLAPMQVKINRMLDKAERVEKMHATGRMAIQRGTKLVKTQLNDMTGAMLEFSTVPPTVLAPPMLPAEFYAMLERHVQRMYDLAGVSRDQAAGVKDKDVKSGAAIRESIDVQQANIALPEQRWENFHLELIRRGLDLVRDVVASGGAYQAVAPNRRGHFLTKLDWKEMGTDEKNYILTKYPAGILSMTPAGRKDDVIELVNAHLWTKERGLAALDDMDGEAAMSFERAAEDDLERIIEGILYDGEWEAPEPYHNHMLGTQMAAKYLQMAKAEGAQPMNIDLLRQWLDDCAAYLPPPAPGGPMAPMATPPLPPGMVPPPV